MWWKSIEWMTDDNKRRQAAHSRLAQWLLWRRASLQRHRFGSNVVVVVVVIGLLCPLLHRPGFFFFFFFLSLSLSLSLDALRGLSLVASRSLTRGSALLFYSNVSGRESITLWLFARTAAPLLHCCLLLFLIFCLFLSSPLFWRTSLSLLCSSCFFSSSSSSCSFFHFGSYHANYPNSLSHSSL